MFRRAALVAHDSSGREERTPMCPAFQVAAALAPGSHIVESTASAPLEAIAVRDDVRHGERADAPGARMRRLPVIDPARSGDGRGLERGAESTEGLARSTSARLELGGTRPP